MIIGNKKLLGILVLGLLFCNVVFAAQTVDDYFDTIQEENADKCPGILLNKEGYCKKVNEFLQEGFKIINTATEGKTTIFTLQKRNTLIICHSYASGTTKCNLP